MVGYNAAKEANRALTRTAAREWAQHNITVNCIIPGMLTEGSKEFFDANPEHYKNSLANIPLGRLGDPEKDAGSLVVFLASEGAHYLTGETFDIDGGRCLRP
jgi:NAD(P)-dependent dehydrogenase (short-subunit alcohol dehydrogenase family)